MKHELDRMMSIIKDYETGYGGVTDSFLRKELEMFAKDYHKEQCNIPVVSKHLSIKLEDWHYQCGDGCCDLYGTEIALNGKKCDNGYAGNDVRTALEFVLTELGYEVDIDFC